MQKSLKNPRKAFKTPDPCPHLAASEYHLPAFPSGICQLATAQYLNIGHRRVANKKRRDWPFRTKTPEKREKNHKDRANM